MSAPEGNKFWERRLRSGALPKYENDEALRLACIEYFEWLEANPLQEQKAFSGGEKIDLDKMRAPTIVGLCIYLGISTETWYTWKDAREDLSDIQQAAEQIIYEQKFSGAAAGLLNHAIIARELGLVDKTEVKGHFDISEMTEKQIDARIQQLMEKSKGD